MPEEATEGLATTHTAAPRPEPEGSATGLLDGPLWVLHTRARHEKRVAETLEKNGIRFYLPLVTRVRTYGRTRVRFAVPLFPSYVFLCGAAQEVEVAWKTNRVANVLRVNDQDSLRHELRQIERVLQAEQPITLYAGLREGRRCRVISGPLAGTEGMVLRWRGAHRLYLAVTFIGQSVVVEIDAALLEPVE